MTAARRAARLGQSVPPGGRTAETAGARPTSRTASAAEAVRTGEERRRGRRRGPAMEWQMNEDDVAPPRPPLPGPPRRATTAQLAPHVRAVDAALAGGTRPRRRYWGDCYRRA